MVLQRAFPVLSFTEPVKPGSWGDQFTFNSSEPPFLLFAEQMAAVSEKPRAPRPLPAECPLENAPAPLQDSFVAQRVSSSSHKRSLSWSGAAGVVFADSSQGSGPQSFLPRCPASFAAEAGGLAFARRQADEEAQLLEAKCRFADKKESVQLRRRGLHVGSSERPIVARLRARSCDTSVAARAVNRNIQAHASNAPIVIPRGRAASPRILAGASLDSAPLPGQTVQIASSLVPKPIPMQTTRSMWQPRCAPALISRISPEQPAMLRCLSRERTSTSSASSFVAAPRVQEAIASVHGMSGLVTPVVTAGRATATAVSRSCSPTCARVLTPTWPQSSAIPRPLVIPTQLQPRTPAQPPVAPSMSRSPSPILAHAAAFTPPPGTAVLQTTTYVRHKVVYELTPVAQEPGSTAMQMEMQRPVVIPDISATRIAGQDDFCPETMVRLRCGNFSTVDVSRPENGEALDRLPRQDAKSVAHAELRCGELVVAERPKVMDGSSRKIASFSPEGPCASRESSVKTLTPKPPAPRGPRTISPTKIAGHDLETCKTQ